MKFFKTFFLIVLVTSCAPIYVNFDYEKQHDFTKYKTYNYYSDIETGFSELDTKRLLYAMDEALKAKGFTLSSTPDFFINITSSDLQESQNSALGVGVGGGGISIGIPIGKQNVNKQIIFDFIDENGIGLFWQALSESSFNPNAKPEQRELQLKAIVDKVLVGYPPK